MLWHYFPHDLSKKKEDLEMCPDNVFMNLPMHFLLTFQLVKVVLADFNRLRPLSPEQSADVRYSLFQRTHRLYVVKASRL